MLTSTANRQLSEVDRDLIEQRIRAYWGLRGRDKVDLLSTFVAKDCVYTGQTWVGQPVDIRREGREGFVDFVHYRRSLVERLDTTHLEMVIDGNSVAACRRLKLRARGTGRVGEISVCSFVQFRNAEIVEISELIDPLAMTRLLAP